MLAASLQVRLAFTFRVRGDSQRQAARDREVPAATRVGECSAGVKKIDLGIFLKVIP